MWLQDGTVVRKHNDQLVTRSCGRPLPWLPASVSNPMVEETGDPGFFEHDVNSPEITHEGRALPSEQATYSGQDTPVRRYLARDRKVPQLFF